MRMSRVPKPQAISTDALRCGNAAEVRRAVGIRETFEGELADPTNLGITGERQKQSH